MKAFKFSILFLSLVLFGVAARAQQGNLKVSLDYAIGVPTGKLKNLTGETSLRGWRGAVMYGVKSNLSIGLELGSQNFYEKFPRGVIHQSDGSDISAVISNSIQVLPILVKGKYGFNKVGVVEPFAALGVGGNFILNNKYYGEFATGNTKFGFAAQPELGISVPFGRTKRNDFHVSAGYAFMPYEYGDADGLNHTVIKAGISIPLR